MTPQNQDPQMDPQNPQAGAQTSPSAAHANAPSSHAAAPSSASSPTDPSSTDPVKQPPAGQSSNTQSAASQSPADIEKIQAELADARQKLQEMTGISQRALADLQNFKRRVEEEKSAFIDFANAALFAELLPAVENIGRAIGHDPKDADWIKGATETMRQITQICEKHGLQEIPAKPGTPFDHNKHEALMTAPGEKDTILEVLEKGYMLGERVLKPARVKVGNG